MLSGYWDECVRRIARIVAREIGRFVCSRRVPRAVHVLSAYSKIWEIDRIKMDGNSLVIKVSSVGSSIRMRVARG